ncbi:MAG: ribbon-helix-helix domain-containing protein [Candidatus Methanoperedens sp.]|nr:ribbon-helix-helix domain-containing protein [Candidatus Methanoperedens sp.]
MVKIKVSHTIDEDLIKRVDYDIATRRFASRSHAIEYALEQLFMGWDCRKKIITEEDNDHFKIEATKSAFIVLLPGAITNRIKIPVTGEYGMELTLKDTNGNDLPDREIITIWRQKQHLFDNSSPSGEWLEDCAYGELKRKFTPRNEIIVSPYELLALYIKGNEYIKKGIRVENIRFIVDLCTKR